MREGKAGVAGHEKIVAGVVLQLKRVAGAGNQSHHRTANGETRLRAANLYIRNIALDSAGAVHHRTDLRRNGRLGQNGHGVGHVRCKRRCKRERDISAARNSKIVAGVILQNQPRTDETSDITTDGKHVSANNLDIDNSRGGGARRGRDAADLRWIRWLGLHRYGIGGLWSLKGESTVRRDCQVVAAVVLQNQSSSREADYRAPNIECRPAGTGPGAGTGA